MPLGPHAHALAQRRSSLALALASQAQTGGRVVVSQSQPAQPHALPKIAPNHLRHFGQLGPVHTPGGSEQEGSRKR
jgi:hypothetical protein